MHEPQTDATQYHAQLGLPDKGSAIKGLVVCNSWDLEPWDLLNSLALGRHLRYDSYYVYICLPGCKLGEARRLLSVLLEESLAGVLTLLLTLGDISPPGLVNGTPNIKWIICL